jgi:hypothetical protein
MGKYKDYIIDYQNALAKRTLPQVRRAEEIAERVERTKIQEQKMLGVIERRHKHDSSKYLINLLQKLN